MMFIPEDPTKNYFQQFKTITKTIDDPVCLCIYVSTAINELTDQSYLLLLITSVYGMSSLSILP